jgi:hypothetical protein
MITTLRSRPPGSLLLKVESIKTRARLLTGMRKMIGLKPHQDISAVQWEILDAQLTGVSVRVRDRLRLLTDKFLSEQHDLKMRQKLVDQLGELELDLNSAYLFYDTFMDILTQRLSDDLGPLLRGCDVIAANALQRSFMADTTIPPLVYCERGFGAFTLREGVNLSKSITNPIPFIAIPYSRINEKYNLISINHEVGHQALMKLNMKGLWQQVFREALKKANASPVIQDLYANWSTEIVPDFWAFCLSGMAQTCSIRDVLVLPTRMMFNISGLQPHPPSFLRFLISVECCRQLWGTGDWDAWEADWIALYPMTGLDDMTKQLIITAKQFIPLVAKTLINTRFKKLNNKPITSLFALETISPQILKAFSTPTAILSTNFRSLSIGAQLGVFRLIREKNYLKPTHLDSLMSSWLQELKTNN